ncbi:MAG TPA: 4Fe-4S double cluster binding domain-containing protein [Xanthobacteraceae bacterium]
MTLTRELETFARRHGADLFGVADLRKAREYLAARGGPAAGFAAAVALAMRVNDGILDEHDPAEARERSLYWHHVYSVVTPALDTLAFEIARWLAHRRFRAFPVPASTPYDSQRLEGIISHKLAARLAGLGWIGKNCLLLTPKLGPRLRLVTVLTDAPLEPAAPTDKRCGSCRACIEACPVQAFSGAEFSSDQEREARFDAFRCYQYRHEHACGMCVAVCPVGSGWRTPKPREPAAAQ